MIQNLLLAMAPLAGLGFLAAMILYIAAKKFYVYEDPRIDAVESALPGANCGGCSFPGCRNFAEAAVKAVDKQGNLGDLFCPVGGNEAQKQVAEALGVEVQEQEPKVAVIRCHGTLQHRTKINTYNGANSCQVAAIFFSGDTGCSYGCLGLGDCVEACDFAAMYMDWETGLPVVIEEKCTSCGACVDICPKGIIELRQKGKKGKRVYVRCVNQDKGGVAKKACDVACIGCKRCVKVCDKFNAIEVNNFLAYIDQDKCRLCRKCLDVCNTGAIHAVNFPPPRAPKTEQSVQNDDTQQKLART